LLLDRARQRPRDISRCRGCAGDAQERAIVLVGDDQQCPIGRNDNIAHATVSAVEDPLLGHEGAAAVALHARQKLEFQCCDEKIAVPFGKHLAAIDGDGTRGDRGVPVVERLFQPRLGGAFTNLGTGIVAAVGDDGPAVVLARFDAVDLVAAARAVLDGVELAVGGVEGDALRVAVALRPDLGQCLCAILERVVGGNAAVRIDMDDGTGIVLPVLGTIPVATVADADEKRAVFGDSDARPVLDAAAGELAHLEDRPDVFERGSVRRERGAEGFGAGAAITRRRGRQVQCSGCCEVRGEFHIKQATLASGADLGNT
jgi:hypothetical protein